MDVEPQYITSPPDVAKASESIGCGRVRVFAAGVEQTL